MIHELIEAYGLRILFGGITLECLGMPLVVAAALYAGSTNELAIGSIVRVAAAAATVGGDNVNSRVPARRVPRCRWPSLRGGQ
jgi:hypothetical protein